MYQISNLGRVKSLERYDKYNRYVNEKILVPRKHTQGYLRVSLGKKDYYIHRLVAETFIENKENKPYINHKDGDKTNNKVENLEWCTAKENMLHAFYVLKYADNDFMKKISNCKKRKEATKKRRLLNDKQVLEIRKSKESDKILSEKYNVSRGTIFNIRKYKTYKEVK